MAIFRAERSQAPNNVTKPFRAIGGERPSRVTAAAFLVAIQFAATPYKKFTRSRKQQWNPVPLCATLRRRVNSALMTHMFDMRCRRINEINHPRTNGQVERMNRTTKEATVKRYHYDSHDQLRHHLVDFVDAYNFGRRLKSRGSSGL